MMAKDIFSNIYQKNKNPKANALLLIKTPKNKQNEKKATNFTKNAKM